MTTPPRRVKMSPGSGEGSGSGTSNGVENKAVWEQMCHMQSDIRQLTKQSKEVIEINRAMLEEQQTMRELTIKLLDNSQTLTEEIRNLVSETRTLVEETRVLGSDTRSFMEKIENAMLQLSSVIDSNDKNTDDILELLYQVIDENRINMEFMNGSIETIAQAALTLAYANGDSDEAVQEAKTKALDDILKDKETNEKLREYIRALLEKAYAEERAKKMEGRKKPQE